MSLKSIANDVLPWKSGTHQKPQSEDPKSHPYYYYKQFGPREAPAATDSSRPRNWYPAVQPRRPVDLSLTTDDIEGSRPRATYFITKRRTNPLDPEYQLPSHSAPVFPASSRLKGAIPTNFISDIAGTHPRRLHPEHHSRTQSLDLQSSRKFKCLRGGGPNSLDVRDINGSDCRRPRNTNPLDPTYTVSVSNGSALQLMDTNHQSTSKTTLFGPIDDSKPRQRIRANSIPPPDPIEGSSPQRYVGVLRHSTLENSPVYTRAPITGSRAGSLTRGFVSKRVTNPLDPSYILLDGKRDMHDIVVT